MCQGKVSYLIARSDLTREECLVIRSCNRRVLTLMEVVGFSTFATLWMLRSRGIFKLGKTSIGEAFRGGFILMMSFGSGMGAGAYTVIRNDEQVHPIYMRYQFDDPRNPQVTQV